MAVKKKLEKAAKAYDPYLAKVEVDHPDDGPLEIELPRVDMRCVMRVSTSVSRLADGFKEALPSGVFDKATDPDNTDVEAGTSLIAAIPSVLPRLLDEVIIVLSEYLDEDVDWLAKLEPEDIIKLFSPFLTRILEIGTSVFSRFGTRQGSDTPTISSEPLGSTEISPTQEPTTTDAS
jgi:hypothetical protein